ncbi:MAG: peptide deformylase [Alphaproteobacteria bacterium]|nr:peptide deformylase [Alphaproteobacteria bacterium]
MAILDIILAPDPRLTAPCEPVEAVDGALQRLMDDMLETMYKAPGIGLAAPQVGVMKRFFVVDVGEENARDPRFFINPEITDRSETTSVYEEGCLSLPKQFADVERSDAVSLRYRDRRGAERTLDADGMLARCIQHEMDHLDGILFIDHLSALKRRMILRRMTKAKRAQQTA